MEDYKENYDEKIRKALINRFNESGELDGIPYDDIRIWLEKAGKQKPTEIHITLKEAAKEYSGKESHPLNNAFIAGAKWQEEQNFTWSEEDELCMNQAIYVCHQNGYTAVENKLKSFKKRMKGE